MHGRDGTGWTEGRKILSKFFAKGFSSDFEADLQNSTFRWQSLKLENEQDMAHFHFLSLLF